MGASGSRSKTQEVIVQDYTKLMRAPEKRRRHTVELIRFGDLTWEVTVRPMRFNEETGVSDYLIVAVWVGLWHSLESARGTLISVEILDHTGEHTVFHSHTGHLGVRRSELEASSCIHVQDDSFLVRCTFKEKQRPSLLGDLFSSKSMKQPQISDQVPMTTSHTLTVDSLSNTKAALLPRECVHSTHFAVGGTRWYLKLYPTLAVVRLVRATHDITVTRAEFSFALEGAVNAQSGMMAHAFHRDSPDCEFPYQLTPEEPGTACTDSLVVACTDSLVVRCCVRVIPDAVAPTAVTIPVTVPRAVIIPAAVIPAHVPPPDESVLTPLLRAMHG